MIIGDGKFRISRPGVDVITAGEIKSTNGKMLIDMKTGRITIRD